MDDRASKIGKLFLDDPLAINQSDDSNLNGELPLTEEELKAIESQKDKLEMENEIELANYADAIEGYFDSEVVKNGWAEKARSKGSDSDLKGQTRLI